jgi:DNA-binding CsgD family transcriptional regulator
MGAGPGGYLADGEVSAAVRCAFWLSFGLVTSRPTVRRHLQNLFAKLGVSSRAAATPYAYEHRLR